MSTPVALAVPGIVARRDRMEGLRGGVPWIHIGMAVLALRVLLSAVGAGIAIVLPAPHQSLSLAHVMLDPWRQFDAYRFITIAAHGYQANGLNTAYMPLYPLLLRAVTVVTGGHYLTAGLIVSNIACVAGVGLFWRWVADCFDEAVAWRAVAVMLLFPDSFYLLGAYSESPFLALSAWCLLASRRERPVMAGLAGALAVLTRLQGLVLLVPLAIDLWRRARRNGRARPFDACVAFPAVALLGYQKALSTAVGGTSIVGTFQHAWHISLQPPWSTLLQYVQAIHTPRFSFFHSSTNNYVMVWDLLVALLVLGVLVVSARRLGPDLSLYGLAAWCFALSRWYSTGRYMLAVLPFFIAVSVGAGPKQWRWVAAVSTVLLIFFVSQFVQGSWID
jgi:hypothetical protein